MSLIEWINENLSFDNGPFVAAIMLAILFTIVYDFYHLLFSSVVSWFKK